MCIVFYTLTHPGYKFILASNRDEYLDRPTSPAGWHTFAPLSPSTSQQAINGSASASSRSSEPDDAGWVLSGRDGASPRGGTWLGITRDLRIAVLTNIRIPPVPVPPNAPSRGLLLKDFLAPPPDRSNPSVHEYLSHHRPQVDQYEGFNLFLFQLHPPGTAVQQNGDTQGRLATADPSKWGKPDVGYLSNRPNATHMDIHSPSRTSSPLPDVNGEKAAVVGECCGFSNTPLSQPWPKVSDGIARMGKTLQEGHRKRENEDQLIERLMDMLQQTEPLESIADLSRCTCLHPVKIGADPESKIREGEKGRWYGTRVTTVIMVKESGEVTFVERDIFVQDEQGKAGRGKDERRFRFQAEVVGE